MSRAQNKATVFKQIQGWIKDELDLETQYLTPSSQVPQDTVVVSLEPDRQDRPRVASILFLPMEGGEIEHFDLLQFYLEGPLEIPESAQANYLRLITTANQVIPVGAFSLSDENELVYKYVIPVGKGRALDRDEFLEIFLLWMFTLDNVSSLIEEVVAGSKDLKTAQDELSS